MVNPTPSSSVTYRWNTAGCYTNNQFTGSNPECFPRGQITQTVTGNDLNAEDAGTITCTVTISGSDYTSEPFTLRISGEQLVYCVITCIVYCKQSMLLLLATYILLLYYIPMFIYSSYRGVFTVGVALLRGNSISFANALTDYSYITAGSGTGSTIIACCVTGLGPSGNDNDVLGGLYFFGDRIPNRSSCSSVTIQPIPSSAAAGVINVAQCGAFSTAAEGVYTCTMMNSSMMNESVRFGVYFTGRSESLDLYMYSIT